MNRTTYTFPATFERAISGSIVELNIDLGFEMHVRYVFRLKGIWTPTVLAKNGELERAYAAKNFTHDKLANAHAIKIISYKYNDVYFADVYYQTKMGGKWHDIGARLLKENLGEVHRGYVDASK